MSKIDAFNTIDDDERVNLRFQGEEAYGDGVGRNVVSLFMEEALNLFDGEEEKIPRITAENDLLYNNIDIRYLQEIPDIGT